MPSHLDLGLQGEQIAAEYLQQNGYCILHRNVRCGKRGEIDIIAFDTAENMIVFVEVKTRTTASAAFPIEAAAGFHKRSKLRRAVDFWIVKNNYDGPGRIDLIFIAPGNPVKHYVDING